MSSDLEEVTLLRKENLKRTLQQVHDGASSILLLTTQWKELDQHLENTRSSLDHRSKELLSIQESVNERLQQLKEREQKVEAAQESIEAKEKLFELRSREVESRGKQIEEWSKEVELKEERWRHSEEWSKERELKCERFEQLFQQLEERSREMEVRCKEVEFREKQLELKEKRYANNTQVKTEPQENNAANLRFCVDMDGKCLQIFLNERWKEHDSMRNEVLVALRLSSDPAQLVLDAMEGFYPPHLKKGDVEFTECVIRRTCILLLEQLLQLSPEIKPDVRNEAMKLAFDWVTKMRVKRHSLEILGFLQLLATYGLAHAFDTDELLNYLEIVANHSQTPELLRVLGFADKISGFIRNLIVKKQQLKAIKFIYAFKLVAQFPPIPLLKNQEQLCRKGGEKFKKKRNISFKAWNEDRKKRVADLKAVIRCIEDYKLESEYPPGGLKKLMASLENQNSNSQQTTPAFGRKTPSKQQRGRKRPRTAELAEASPNAFDSGTSNVPSVQMPCQQPKGLTSNQEFIQNLIKSENRLEAIKYIYAWNMVDKFPPVHLLNDHLMYSKNNAEEFCKKNNNSVSAQIGGIRKEISALRNVIRCIEDYKIEPEFSPTILEKRIVELEKKAEEQAKLLQQLNEKKSNAPTSAPAASSSPAVPAPTKVTTPLPTAAPSPATVPETKPQQESGNKRPRIAVSAKQPPHQQPAWRANQGVPYMNAPARQYNLAGYPPMNLNTSSYHNSYMSYYPWDAPRRPDYY